MSLEDSLRRMIESNRADRVRHDNLMARSVAIISGGATDGDSFERIIRESVGEREELSVETVETGNSDGDTRVQVVEES